MRKAKTVFRTKDPVLPDLKLKNPVLIKIELCEDNVYLYIGPRDWQWDRNTGKMVGTGTCLEKQDFPKR